MIVGNTLSEIGDVLYINTSVSFLSNYITLNSYTDNTIGETSTRQFNKQFRVSQDGIAYTDWLELNNINLSTISGNVYNNLIYIQYRYERTGTDTTGLLEFVSINILANAPIVNYSDTIISKTIFNGLSVGSFQTMQLASNLLKKLFKRGIIPEYVERETENDEDYINYWSTIAIFLSMFVTYISNFENMYTQRDILIEYIKQYGLYINDKKETINDLQYLIENLFDEFRKRGTLQIFLRKGSKNKDNSIVNVNGEILRLLCVETCDEFMYTIKKPGLCVGKSSPLCKSTRGDEMLTKRFEKDENVYDLSKYTLINPSNITIDDNKMKLQAASVITGIGYEFFNLASTFPTNGLLVSPFLDYEFSFKFKVDNVALGTDINVRLNSFDCYSNKYQNKDKNGNINNEYCIFTPTQANKTYTFRGTIISVNKSFTNPNINKKPNISTLSGTETNLQFGSDKITKVAPYISVISPFNAVFWIWDIQIRLLSHNKSFGFLNNQNIMEIFSKNNSQLSKLDIYEKIRQDLIPYSINFDNSNLITYN